MIPPGSANVQSSRTAKSPLPQGFEGAFGGHLKGPFGEFLNYAEAIAVAKGRELVKTSLQTLVQEEVNEVEKKTKRNSVEPVARRNGIEAGAPKKSKPPQEP